MPVTFFAERVMMVVASVVGLPEMMPVAVSRVRPTGKPSALKLDGVLSAMMV